MNGDLASMIANPCQSICKSADVRSAMAGQVQPGGMPWAGQGIAVLESVFLDLVLCRFVLSFAIAFCCASVCGSLLCLPAPSMMHFVECDPAVRTLH